MFYTNPSDFIIEFIKHNNDSLLYHDKQSYALLIKGQADLSDPFGMAEEQENHSDLKSSFWRYYNNKFNSCSSRQKRERDEAIRPTEISRREAMRISPLSLPVEQNFNCFAEDFKIQKHVTQVSIRICSNDAQNIHNFLEQDRDIFTRNNITFNCIQPSSISRKPQGLQGNKNLGSVKFEKFDSDSDYSMLVKTLVNQSEMYETSIRHRKDVVTKKVLRTFKKFISTCFKVKNKKPSKLSKPFSIFKQNLLVEAQRIGLYHSENSNENSEEFKEFVCWLAMNKLTRLTKNEFDYDNEAIRLLSDILEKYSHSKLRIILENPHIGRAYKFFVTHGFDKFIESIPDSSKKIYCETVLSLLQCFHRSSI